MKIPVLIALLGLCLGMGACFTGIEIEPGKDSGMTTADAADLDAGFADSAADSGVTDAEAGDACTVGDAMCECPCPCE